jgi:riboflavin kinase/FMN adenylyltransferase
LSAESIAGLDQVRDWHRGFSLTIGNFDGVHVGHQRTIGGAVAEARALGTGCMALTFDPHPVRVLAPDRELRLLTTQPDKVRLLHHFGVDAVLTIDFDHEFAAIGAEEFVRTVIVERLGARSVTVGHNYNFGRGKRGTTEMLRRLGREHGFAVRIARSARRLGDVVSSSRIRALVQKGKVAEAAVLLGRPYCIQGTVGHGAGRGADVLHTPTANITTPNELVPRQGVYAVRVLVGHGPELHDAVASIGTNPTFTPEADHLSYEVHLLDFAANLRGAHLKVFFVERLRGERTYPTADALMAQIARDIKQARTILKRRKNPPVLL